MSKQNHVVIDRNGSPITNTDHPLHPGNIIEMEADARGMKKKDVAKHLGILPGHLSELFKEKRHVSAIMAIKLEELFEVEADFWMRVQANYDLVKARQKLREKSHELLYTLKKYHPNI